jgi:hypothetical protein
LRKGEKEKCKIIGSFSFIPWPKRKVKIYLPNGESQRWGAHFSLVLPLAKSLRKPLSFCKSGMKMTQFYRKVFSAWLSAFTPFSPLSSFETLGHSGTSAPFPLFCSDEFALGGLQ